MLSLVLAHFVAAGVAPLLVARLGRRAFLALALVPAAACAWALTHSEPISQGGVLSASMQWAPSLKKYCRFYQR